MPLIVDDVECLLASIRHLQACGLKQKISKCPFIEEILLDRAKTKEHKCPSRNKRRQIGLSIRSWADFQMRAFISYSGTDRKFAGAVKQSLEDFGVESFLAHEDIQVSEEWKARILQELRDVDLFVTVLSANFKTSDWCSQEIGFIVSRSDVVIVPLSIDQTKPYGFFSHIQGEYVSNESAIPAIIEDLLYRKRPRDMIPIQIDRVRKANSFRNAETAVRPLVPHFKIFTNREVEDFAAAVSGNYEVWDAALCRSEYLPKFVAVCGVRIPDSLKNELKAKVEHLSFPEKPI